MYKLNQDGTFAHKLGTLEYHNVESSTEYLAGLAAGNTPRTRRPHPRAPHAVDSAQNCNKEYQ